MNGDMSASGLQAPLRPRQVGLCGLWLVPQPGAPSMEEPRVRSDILLSPSRNFFF